MDSQLAVHYENETGASFTDSLTGLFNHGFFQISLDREIKSFKRYGNVFTIALIDVDSFAHYNFSYGPLEGDRLLKEIAQVIEKNVRQVDLPARYSGNVFAIIVTLSITAAFSANEFSLKSASQNAAVWIFFLFVFWC